MIRRALPLGLLLSLAACGGDTAVPSPWQEPPSLALDLRVQVAPREVSLLQPITVTIDRFRKDGVEVSFAPVVDDQQFVTKDSTTSDERAFGSGFWQRTTMILLPIDGPGELVIPPFHVVSVVAAGEVAQVATTPEQKITVTTTLMPEHGAEIEAPGDPFPTPANAWLWGSVIGGMVLILALASWFVSRRRTVQHALTIAVPAHVKALRELLRWRSAVRNTPSEVDAFYVGVSQVLRVYLEDRFGVHAPERTTEEFLRDLDSTTALVRDRGSDLMQFLSQCDLVKFAKAMPTEADHLKTYQLAESFIEATRQDRVPDQVADRNKGVSA